MAHVTCNISCVTCHVSNFTCHMSCVTYHFLWQSGEASLWRVCYQWGLPRLVIVIVYCILTHNKQENRLCKSEENHRLDHEVHKVKVIITLMSKTDRGSIWARQFVDEMIFWWLKNGECIRIISLQTNVLNKYN